MIENLLFGYMNDDAQHCILNVITYYAKHYIYCEKQKERPDICFYRFLPYLVNNMEKEQKSLNKNIKNVTRLNIMNDIVIP